MGIKQMQGTSAYLEYIGPKGRKRKKDCIYNRNNECHHLKSQNYLLHCVGRLYCSYYNDLEIEDNIDSNKCETDFIYKKHYRRDSDGRNRNNNEGIYLSKEKLINKKVILLDIEANEIIEITIVNEKDKDELVNKISINSPLGNALCGTYIGSKFEVVQGSNTVKYMIKNVLL